MTELAASPIVIEVIYLIASALFILSLKWLSSPTTARHGIWAGEIGMVLAIAGTLLHHGIVDYKWIFIALVLGTIIGIPLGSVAMTAVPQRTALSHAFGAFCVTLVGTAEFYLRTPDIQPFMMSVLCMEVILGGLTFTGSLMAAGKLQEVLPQRPITYRGQNLVNFLLLAVAVVIAGYLILHPEAKALYPAMVGIALVFGVLMTVLGLAVVQAATARAMADIDAGRPAGVVSSYRGLRGRLGALIRALVFVVVVQIVLDLTIVLIPVALFFLVRWSLLGVVAGLEDDPRSGVLRRSTALTGRHWWRTAIVVLGVTGGALLVGPLIGAIVLVATSASFAVVNMIAAIVNVAALPFAAIALTYLYYDLCAREHERATASDPGTDAAPVSA